MDSGTFLVNILKINKSAKDLIKDSPVYRSCFDEWRNHRITTIKVVEDLSKKINNVHQVSNVTKGAGAVVSIVGGVASVAGIALKLTGHETASKVVRNANIAQVIGSVTTTLATLAEFGLTRKVEKEIKCVLQKDVELMKVLDQWFQRSVRLNSVVQEVFGYDIQSQLFRDVLKICYQNIKLMSSAATTIDSIVVALQKQVQHSRGPELPDKIYMVVVNIMERINDNPRLIEPLRNVCEILMKNDTLLDMLLMGLKLNNLMQILFNFDLISNVLATFNLPLVAYASEIPHAASITVGIALNAVIAVFAAKNFQKGSEYSDKLMDIAYELKRELNCFDAQYKQIEID